MRASGLAPATHLSLPDFADVPPVIASQEGEDKMAQVALAMIEASLADPSDWNGDVALFLALTLERWCGTLASDFKEMFGLQLVLSSRPWAEGYPDDTEWDRLYLSLYQEPNDHYAVGLQASMETLVKVSRRFPSMFWGRLAGALRAIGLEVWDHEYAIAEELHGWLGESIAEWDLNIEEGEENPHPRPTADTPKYLREASGTDDAMRRLLRRRGVVRGTWEGELLWGVLDLEAAAEHVRESMRENGLNEGEEASIDRLWWRWPVLVSWIRNEGDALTHLWDRMGEDLWQSGEPAPPVHVWPFEVTAREIIRVYGQLESFAGVLSGAARILRILRSGPGPLPLAVVLQGADMQERVRVRA